MQDEVAEAAAEISAEGVTQPDSGVEQPEADAAPAEQAAGEAAGEEQAGTEADPDASKPTEAETFTADEVAKLEHGYNKSRQRVERERDEAKAELESMRAKLAETEAKAAVTEEQKLTEEAKAVQDGLTFMRSSKSQWMDEVRGRYPSLSDEQVNEMFVNTRESLIERGMAVNAKLTAAVMKSRGTQTVNTTTTTTVRSQPAALKATPGKPKPTTVTPQGAAGAGSGLRNAGPRSATYANMEARAKALGGGVDAAIQAAAEAMGDIPTAAQTRQQDMQILARGGLILD